jgi:prolyl-tRNA synthetase
MMGGKMAHEFMYLTPIGEDTLILCGACGYTANRQVARFRKAMPAPAQPLPLEKVATPGVNTIKGLADFLNVSTSQTAKAVFMVASIPEGEVTADKFVFAVIRGDMEVNETKVANAVKAKELRPARDEEIRAIGAAPGYASPIGLPAVTPPIILLVDDAIPNSLNLVAGANEDGYHLLNTNYGRDYTAHIVADIAAAEEGHTCPKCGSRLQASRGVEVGNIFKLGTRYSEALGATFLDQDGQSRPVIMGSYGIGVGRLMACVAEHAHDENGLIWPVSVAPYHVHLVSLPGGESQAEQLYRDLTTANIEVLFDDRNERAGVKFKDADIIGLPVRVTVSERSLTSGGVELKRRTDKAASTVPLASARQRVKEALQELENDLRKRAVTVPYRE